MEALKNWKSTLAFIIFVGVYVFTVYDNRSVDIIEVAGNIALYSSIFMMLRSQLTATIVEKIIDKLPTRK